MDRIWAHELRHKGGKWLAAARSWLQHKRTTEGIRGDNITWGDRNARFELGADSIEDLAAEVAAAVYNEQGDQRKRIEDLRKRIFFLQAEIETLKNKKE